MENKTIEEIRTLFIERTKREDINNSTMLKDLGLDSLDVVEMCLDLEERYKVQFTTEELSSFKTFGDLLKSIQGKLEEK